MNTTATESTARREFKVQVALHRGSSFVGRLIRWQSRSCYTHAALVFYGDIVIEAREFKGVRQTEGIVAEAGTEVDIFTVPVTANQHTAILGFALSQVGKGYDYTMVARFVSRRQESRRTTGKWFCSELVFAAFQKAGINLLDRTQPWEVAPGLLSRSPLIQYDQSIGFPKS